MQNTFPAVARLTAIALLILHCTAEMGVAADSPSKACDESIFAVPNESQRWRRAGFNDEEQTVLQRWLDPQEACTWRASGFTLDEIVDWRVAFTPKDALPWKSAGFTSAQALALTTSGIGSVDATKPVFDACEKPLEPLSALADTNPFDTKDRCYYFSGKTIQILSKSTALVRAGTNSYLINFAKNSAPRGRFNAVVKGVGTHKYVDTLGSTQIVPSMLTLAVRLPKK